MPDHEPPFSPDELSMLLSAAAGRLANNTEPGTFLDWIADVGPKLAPTMAAAVDPRTGPVSAFFRLLGVQIYNRTPLPRNDFRIQPLPRPGRNDPCICGSGRKYKQCCQAMEGLALLGDYNMLRHVLDRYSQKQLAAVADSQVDTEAVADTAVQWLEDGEMNRVLALLEPWFKPGIKLKRDHGVLFDLLADIYLETDRPLKRKRLVEAAVNAEDRDLRADGLQRQATMRLDGGDYEGAWESFRAAQRLTPDSPVVALLEITLLAGSGDLTRARERARFWLAKFRRSKKASPEILELLESVSENPERLLGQGILPRFAAEAGQLQALFNSAPAVAAHYGLEGFEGEYMVVPDKTMAALEEAWYDEFPHLKPVSVQTQHRQMNVWANARGWLAVLERHPTLWNSFEVLDDLIMAVDALADEALEGTLLEPLLERAEAVLDQNLEKKALTDEFTLPWLIMENRPVLRPLAFSAFHISHTGGESTPEFIRLAEKLLRLNPTDNHGVREALSTAYIRMGDYERTVALAEQYPDDMICTLPLNRVLALYLSGKKGRALTALNDIADSRKLAISMLLAQNPPEPELSAHGISIGGADEAWLYREETMDLWLRGDALEWLGQAAPATKSRSGKRK